MSAFAAAGQPLLDHALLDALRVTQSAVARGRVVQAFGTTLRVSGLRVHIGQQCLIRDPAHPQAEPLRAEVVGLREHDAILVPLGHMQGVSMGSEVEVIEQGSMVPVGAALLGRVIDAFGDPLDGQPLPLSATVLRPFQSEPPNPLARNPIERPFVTGVRAIDGLLTVGEGQRLGVFAMAGGGKSTLLGMLARQARSDVNVIALVGERGREVREFLEHSLGPEGCARSVVVVSTSDRSAMERLRAAQTATALAEYFRAQGQRVLLLMDSVTRYARALREIGLSVGEPAVRRGFPPSVFAELPRLFERAGNDAHGSITAFYTVLAEDEDGSDPVAEETRSILDGHIVLSRSLGQAGHYPAIDVLASTSRVFNQVTSDKQQKAAQRVRALMAKYEEIRFLVQVGEYAAGSDQLADAAIKAQPAIKDLLRQRPDQFSAMDETLQRMQQFVT
ncbi:MAG: FliI/YscN family ATPase [Burkholderiaceae bacterium]|jgi:type III secretion protein N (ATPase)|nr:FliI/YscN family ATPase [Burkholderiaceae bacterium]